MSVETHLNGLAESLAGLRAQAPRLIRWGSVLARRLTDGGRLLAAGNGGSAAEAQHLTAELVGRFRDDRQPFSAIALCAESSSVTAIGNDYGYDQVFARQVTAHARPQDVVVLLSTSGRSRNLIEAAKAARLAGAHMWAMTGPAPNPLAEIADEVLALPGDPANVQEAHLVAVHALCAAFEAVLDGRCSYAAALNNVMPTPRGRVGRS
ncbi:D-sedoheptulose-7-phosphate isomerase [Saccharothrix sp. ALI-22-I]|uniref:D-sedoheptulose-7-phosphate isomerase n=1 Tax=Saccharothrix sp. ALI-22-I TaxID=1933778 RepID=UPI000A02B9DD|nr:SIS domain-containing protein [Saccharothrix sp. ALI-22-I]